MFTTIVAIGTIVLQVVIVLLIIGLCVNAPFLPAVSRASSLVLKIVFVGAIVGSLVYQYGFGYEPCLLCWYQRIAIFGVGILAFTADIRTSALLRVQVFTFSVAGFAVALLHNYIDIFPSNFDVCGATGPSCLMRYVHAFGYITIPMMSATILLAGILLILVAKRFPQQLLASSTS